MKTVTTNTQLAAPMDFDRWMREQGPVEKDRDWGTGTGNWVAGKDEHGNATLTNGKYVVVRIRPGVVDLHGAWAWGDASDSSYDSWKHSGRPRDAELSQRSWMRDHDLSIPTPDQWAHIELQP